MLTFILRKSTFVQVVTAKHDFQKLDKDEKDLTTSNIPNCLISMFVLISIHFWCGNYLHTFLECQLI